MIENTAKWLSPMKVATSTQHSHRSLERGMDRRVKTKSLGGIWADNLPEALLLCRVSRINRLILDTLWKTINYAHICLLGEFNINPWKPLSRICLVGPFLPKCH
jgi:hypothetical protein